MRKPLDKELVDVLIKLSESGWDLIDVPCLAFLNGADNKEDLIKALKQADEECGDCGCEYDPLYKIALTLLGDE